jgi:phosphatidylserine/phosphatidylglycerophosphate/cardiolipin synthase-like enzyme
MHHKFAVVDRQTVLTGSYNWTMESEDENHENLIIMRETDLVEAYLREFDVLWTGATRENSWG